MIHTVVRRDVLLPLLLLLVYAAAFGARSLGASPVIGFDDHPGQLYRLWHVLQHGFAPWAWNPGWWAGYPELQFYPPGFAILGALLHRGSLGMLSPSAAYHVLAWVTYVAPALTTFALLSKLVGQGWSALPGAFLALTLSAGVASGVEGGVHWGMLPARLGWALLPLLILILGPWVDGKHAWPLLAAPIMAAVVFIHPAHLPTAVFILVLAAAARPHERSGRLKTCFLVFGLSSGLTAFWTLPLIARLENARPLAWGSLETGPAMSLAKPLPLVLLGLAVLALRRPTGPHRGTVSMTARLPWIMTVVVAADAGLAAVLGLVWLPADRVADGGWMALLLAAGYGGGRYLARLGPVVRPLWSLGCILGLAILSLPGHVLTLWPSPTMWPTLASIEHGFRLPALWATLRAAPDGHVLFTRSALPLIHGTAWYRPHSHATALTPLGSGRRIIHGTFTHPSPVAALVYRGDAGRAPITELAERLDGHRLLGHSLNDLDPDTFNLIADRLGICTVVVLDEDVLVGRAMLENPHFERWRSTPPFLLYTRREPCSLPTRIESGRWRVVLAGTPGTWVSVRSAYYPLWNATQEGRSLAVRRGVLGELEVKLRAAGLPVELSYRAGVIEWSGIAVSVSAALVWLTLLVAGPRLRREGHS